MFKCLQKTLSKFLGAFIPEPTAVPPCARYSNSFLAISILFKHDCNCVVKAENSSPKVMGVASCV